MKTLTLALAATALSASAAFAAADIQTLDQNGDRFATFAETSAVYPGLTQNDFRDIDTNNDRRLSSVELLSVDAQAVLGRYTVGTNGLLDLASVDTDGDNFVSFTELAGAYPGLSANDWETIGGNDGRVTASELYALDTQVILDRAGAAAPTLVSLDALDSDGSSFASFGEISTVYPGLSEVNFRDIDANDDNRISFAELYALDARTILDRAGR